MGCCGFTPEPLEPGATVGVDWSAGTLGFAAAALAGGAAVGAGWGTEDPGVAAGFTFAPSGKWSVVGCYGTGTEKGKGR